MLYMNGISGYGFKPLPDQQGFVRVDEVIRMLSIIYSYM